MSGRGRPAWRRVDEWLVLGGLGALLALSLLLVHVPAALWAGNTGEFHWRFSTFLRFGLGAVSAGLVPALLIMAIAPRPARAVLACLVCAVGLVCWVYASFLTGHMTALNGIDAPMNFETPLGMWELPAVGVVCLLMAGAIGRAPRAAMGAMLVLNIGLAGATAVSVRSARWHRVGAPAPQDPGPVFRWSTRDNVLVVLLDGLQSDIARDIIRGDPELRSAFDGFRSYPNTLGVAPTTFVSLPAIHSGITYEGPERLGAYFEESIRIRSFVNRFAEAGYDTLLVNPMEGVCPDRIHACPSSAQILRTGEAQLRSESLRLFDVSLFRLAPVWLKKRIYDNGSWFLAGRFDMPEETSRIFEHNLLLAEMARRIAIDNGPPTLKFVHSLATHTPFVLNSDCRTLGENGWAQLAPQARCALLAVAGLLRALEAAHVYDRTEVAVLADHGIGHPIRYGRHAATRSPDAVEWARRSGYANPMFLLKPRGARGTIRDDPATVDLTDLGATLCASSRACTAPGVPVGQAASERTRRFIDYEWQHGFWHLRSIPDVIRYDVRGPVWDPRSWRRANGTRHEEVRDSTRAGRTTPPPPATPPP